MKEEGDDDDEPDFETYAEYQTWKKEQKPD